MSRSTNNPQEETIVKEMEWRNMMFLVMSWWVWFELGNCMSHCWGPQNFAEEAKIIQETRQPSPPPCLSPPQPWPRPTTTANTINTASTSIINTVTIHTISIIILAYIVIPLDIVLFIVVLPTFSAGKSLNGETAAVLNVRRLYHLH